MSAELIGFILDTLILIMLGVTVFYAARLSVHIKNFRTDRKALQGLMKELTSNVDKADLAIDGLRENAKQSGRDLQKVINDAQALFEELQIMIDSGDRLAVRLEKGVDKTAKDTVQPVVNSTNGSEAEEKSVTPATFPDVFSIRDPEFEDEEYQDDAAGNFSDNTDMQDDGLSKAERELYEALQSNKVEGGVS